ncbi:helix-turn-helix domain-containing protein [Aquisalibacillus elongatus]|uniref:Transposase n=1 Tax=Aquisalibacillus elongatus TaxID=485577 RepID=A0A3N5C458_9BACI|nr:helix-turn-helix domain-containing protein [Aquisalibacillus elongatus]RPF57018.1 transposase [Aquisalibacillus elongatus]
MAKYSDSFKLKIVKEYLEGPMGYRLLAKKYNVPDKAQIRIWVNAYKAFGEDGLRKKRSKTVYPVQFKLDVLNFIRQTGTSYKDTAIEFKLRNPSLIANWMRTFLIEGIEGLKEKPKGRAPMSGKRKTKQSKQEKAMSREEQLERENELLRLENAYLKKLKAFQENPNAYLEKHKQRWHSNSKKKGSN